MQRTGCLVEGFRSFVKGAELSENFISIMIAEIDKKQNQLDIEFDIRDWILTNKMQTEPPKPPIFHRWNGDPEKPGAPKPHPTVGRTPTKRRDAKTDGNANHPSATAATARAFAQFRVSNPARTSTLVLGKDRARSGHQIVHHQGPMASSNSPRDLSTFQDYLYDEEEGEYLFLGWVRAIYDYKTGEEDELVFSEGTLMRLLHQDESGWWTGELDGKIGLFPGNYVEITLMKHDFDNVIVCLRSITM